MDSSVLLPSQSMLMISFQFPMTLTLSKERKDLYVKNLKLLIKEKSTSFSECQSRGATMLGHCPLVKRSTLLVCSINLEWKDVSTPPEPGKKFHKRTDDKEQCDQSIYQQPIGCLTYVSSYGDQMSQQLLEFRQFMSGPSKDHFEWE